MTLLKLFYYFLRVIGDASDATILLKIKHDQRYLEYSEGSNSVDIDSNDKLIKKAGLVNI